MVKNYDRLVNKAMLMSRPQINSAWIGCNGLFAMLAPEVMPDDPYELQRAKGCGCPVQIKDGLMKAWTEQVERAVMNDPDIPMDETELYRNRPALEALGRVQMLADQTFRKDVA